MGLISRVMALACAGSFFFYGTVMVLNPHATIAPAFGSDPNVEVSKKVDDYLQQTTEKLFDLGNKDGGAEFADSPEREKGAEKDPKYELALSFVVCFGMCLWFIGLLNLIMVFNFDAITGPYLRGMWFTIQTFLALGLLYANTVYPDGSDSSDGCPDHSYKCVGDWGKLSKPENYLFGVVLVASVIGSYFGGSEQVEAAGYMYKPLLGP